MKVIKNNNDFNHIATQTLQMNNASVKCPLFKRMQKKRNNCILQINLSLKDHLIKYIISSITSTHYVLFTYLHIFICLFIYSIIYLYCLYTYNQYASIQRQLYSNLKKIIHKCCRLNCAVFWSSATQSRLREPGQITE